MAHRISVNNGNAEIAYAGETPWHGLGTRVDGLQTAADMIKCAGLEWTVELRSIYFDARVDGVRPVPGFQAVVRTDHCVTLGIVTKQYQPIQNTQAAEMMDALATEGDAHVEVAGALETGERCWMLAHIPADFEVVSGDAVRPYVLLAWGHDGKHGLAAKLTPIRVVCHNTLTTALGRQWSQTADVYVRHNKNASIRIEEAQRALGLIRKKLEQTREGYRALAATPLDPAGAMGYFGRVFPRPVAESSNLSFEAKLAGWKEHQRKLIQLFETGQGNQLPGVSGTAWAVYNAVTQWTDHTYPVLQSGKVSATRIQSVLFGSYADLKRRALTEALALAG